MNYWRSFIIEGSSMNSKRKKSLQKDYKKKKKQEDAQVTL